MTVDYVTFCATLPDLRSFEPTKREAAQTLIRSVPREQLFGFFGNAIREDDVDLCCDAARCAASVDATRGCELIVSLLDHPSRTVRWFVCGLMASFGARPYIGRIVRLLKDDVESNVRLQAAIALGSFGDRSVIPALQEAAQTDIGSDWEGRTVADAARASIDRITNPYPLLTDFAPSEGKRAEQR